MNILVIDNYTKNISKVRTALSPHKIKKITVDKLSKYKLDYSKFDLIVLTGSSRYHVLNRHNIYEREIEIIKNSPIPVIGICLGHQLINHAFGGTLIKYEKRVMLRHKINIYDKNLSLGLSPTESIVFSSHQWGINKLADCLVPLADSEYGFEIIKHKDREIYGLQFHPEKQKKITNGFQILNNLMHYIDIERIVIHKELLLLSKFESDYEFNNNDESNSYNY